MPERMRCRFAMCACGYVVMPERVHLLATTPEETLIESGMGKAGFSTPLEMTTGN
ncbi:MAG: hypothetical protein WBQ10_23185 [Terriglobales bacterium]